ncbi:MAG: polyprenyl diphosphate synthase [Planctomycetota bacterium]|nr:polyprenyl diphosphate synthase [Planctomycetota bacterium]
MSSIEESGSGDSSVVGNSASQEGVPRDIVPQHVGFIMDGNGRWAQERHLPRTDGHSQGAAVLRQTIRDARDRGISEVTCYALSTENFHRRPSEEIGFLMELLIEHLRQQREELEQMQIQFRAIGRLEALPQETQDTLAEAVRETADNDGIVLRLAINYGGRAEIADAFESFRSSGSDRGECPAGDRERCVIDHLYESEMPDLDLLIRTGGEIRISNFLLWHCSYAELYFTPVLWPDFCTEHFDEALLEYARRVRRFGSIPTATGGGDA